MSMTTTRNFRTLAVLALGLCGFATSAFAQIPEDTKDFTSHGIHVILRNSKANDVIAAFLGVEGGLAYGETANPALSGMTGGVIASSGSKNYPKKEYRNQLAKLSTSINGGGDHFNLSFSLQTIAPNFEQAWKIFSDVIRNPNFDTIEFQKRTQNVLNGIRSRSSDPEGYANIVSDSLWLGNSVLNHEAVESDVEHLTIQDLMNYQKSQLQRSRMTLVVVGKVSREALEKKLAEFESLPMGAFKFPPVDHILPPEKSSVTAMSRDLPTTYFIAKCAAPMIGTKDWWAERVLFEIFDTRLFDEVRTKRNLSYAPGAGVGGTHGNMHAEFTFQSILPDSARGVVFDEIRKLQTKLVPKKELENAKAGRITTFFYIMQTNLEQATRLYSNQIESGDWRNLFRITTETQKVTAEEVKAVAMKYIHHLQFVLLGPEGKVTKSKYTFD
jgi:zinc protease